MELFCPNCDRVAKTTSLSKKEIFKVRGEEIEIDAELSACAECQAEFASHEQESRNYRQAYDLYRRRKGLLSPEEIRKIRVSYGLSQGEFSRLLGWGEITVHRYERGALQDFAHNDTLVLLRDDPKNLLRLLESNRNIIPTQFADRLEGNLRDRIGRDLSCAFEVELGGILAAEKPSIMNGFKRFELSRFESMVLETLRHTGGSFPTSLNKILWYIDFSFFAENGISLTGAQYERLPFGPVPRQYDLLYASMRNRNRIEVEEWNGASSSGEIFRNTNARFPLEFSNVRSSFSKVEQRHIEAWATALGKLTPKEIVRFSHEEDGYLHTSEGGLISYEFSRTLRYRPRQL